LLSLTFLAAFLLLAFTPGVVGSAAAASTVQVSIPLGTAVQQTAGFSPDSITVVIGVNNTVIWTDNDNSSHTVTSLSTSDKFDSGIFGKGQTYTHTFTTPGTYPITCDIHPFMKGTVVVLAGTNTSSTVAEFPVGALGAVLLVLVAAAALASRRLLAKHPASTVIQ